MITLRLDPSVQREIAGLCKRGQSKVDKIFRARNQSGYAFFGLPDNEELLSEIKQFADGQKKYRWKSIVVLGIGGSALGLRAIAAALRPRLGARPELYVIDNIDPSETKTFFDYLDFRKTLFIVISKSGDTVEPMMLYGLARQRLMKLTARWQKHFVFVTDTKGGLLRSVAKKERVAVFDVPNKVAGSFSVLSSVGLLPAALAGVEVSRLLRGAKKMRETLKKTKGVKNPALALATAQYVLDRRHGKSITVIMPYSSALTGFGDWYRQLLAESIGKNQKTGPTPLTALGTTDQHSLLQLFSNGPRDKWFMFLRVLKPAGDMKLSNMLPRELGFLNGKKINRVMDAAYRGTMLSLTHRKCPTVTLDIDQLNAEHLGMLFMLFEFQMALLGLFYGVNPFDQPGVEEGKQITRRLLCS